MKIKEMEKQTGLTAKNIRFYEKEGLLAPKRDEASHYRNYSEEDRERLLQIRLLRKLGVSLEYMRLLFSEQITLQECIGLRRQEIRKELENVERMRHLCESMSKGPSTLKELDTGKYLSQIEESEKKGQMFVNIARDYLTWARNYIPTPAFYFEPEGPVIDKDDFTNEVVRYCAREGKNYELLHQGMEPVFLIDGEKYLFMLEQPRLLELPGIFRLIPFFLAQTYGYKFIYAYPYL